MIRFHQFSLHVRDYREYREFHHERKDGGGDIDHGNKPCFISRKIYLSHVPKGEQKYAAKIRGSIMFTSESPGNARVLKVSRDSLKLWLLTARELVLIIYTCICAEKKERERERGEKCSTVANEPSWKPRRFIGSHLEHRLEI